MQIAVYGLLASQRAAIWTLKMLKQRKFPPEEISILMPNIEAARALSQGRIPSNLQDNNTTALLKWLVDSCAITVRGFGPMITAGPLVSMLAGFQSGNLGKELSSVLISLGLPAIETQRYLDRIQEGCTFISLNTHDQFSVRRALKVLEQSGTEDLSSAELDISPRFSELTCIQNF